MRLRLFALVGGGLLAAAGVRVGAGGRPPAVDMVAAPYSDSLPSPTHLGHWPAPFEGQALFITANAQVAGQGDGGVTFGVLVVVDAGVGVDAGVVCSLTAPCTTGPGDFPTAACPTAPIPAGAEVHLEVSHDCTTAPQGAAVFGFEWRR